jgi:hypothetical protein
MQCSRIILLYQFIVLITALFQTVSHYIADGNEIILWHKDNFSSKFDEFHYRSYLVTIDISEFNKSSIIKTGIPSHSTKSRLFLDLLDFIARLSRIGWRFTMSSKSANYGEMRFFPTERELSSPQIPFLLHQTWKNDQISTHSMDAVHCKAKIDIFAKDFLHILWTDADISEFILIYYPQYDDYYKKLNMNIKRADMARYLILYKYGGVYLDLDIELKHPLNELLISNTFNGETNKNAEACRTEFFSYKSKEFEENKQPFAGNALFGSIPNHDEIIGKMIKHMMEFKHQKVKFLL